MKTDRALPDLESVGSVWALHVKGCLLDDTLRSGWEMNGRQDEPNESFFWAEKVVADSGGSLAGEEAEAAVLRMAEADEVAMKDVEDGTQFKKFATLFNFNYMMRELRRIVLQVVGWRWQWISCVYIYVCVYHENE